jgi:hypothetical protein
VKKPFNPYHRDTKAQRIHREPLLKRMAFSVFSPCLCASVVDFEVKCDSRAYVEIRINFFFAGEYNSITVDRVIEGEPPCKPNQKPLKHHNFFSPPEQMRSLSGKSFP